MDVTTTFIAALIVFGLVMAGMAIGVILSNRRIAGSCGGLANLRDRFGAPMCECGARPGESCGRDGRRTFEGRAPAAPDASGRATSVI